MLKAFSLKLDSPPAIVSIRSNDGRRIKSASSLKRVNSDAFARNYKNQDEVHFPAYLKSDSSAAAVTDTDSEKKCDYSCFGAAAQSEDEDQYNLP